MWQALEASVINRTWGQLIITGDNGVSRLNGVAHLNSTSSSQPQQQAVRLPLQELRQKSAELQRGGAVAKPRPQSEYSSAAGVVWYICIFNSEKGC